MLYVFGENNTVGLVEAHLRTLTVKKADSRSRIKAGRRGRIPLSAAWQVVHSQPGLPELLRR